MARADPFRDYILDQLATLDGLACRAMFGGHGLYSRGVMFGILAGGRLYLKADERSRDAFIAAGMGPFRPNERQTLSSYYEAPAEVVDDRERLVAWAETALAVARAAR